jgi:hypothetical protein
MIDQLKTLKHVITYLLHYFLCTSELEIIKMYY